MFSRIDGARYCGAAPQCLIELGYWKAMVLFGKLFLQGAVCWVCYLVWSTSSPVLVGSLLDWFGGGMGITLRA